MKKILAIIDTLRFTEDQVKEFRNFARKTNSLLAIVCLDNLCAFAHPGASLFPEPAVIEYDQIGIDGRTALQWERNKNLKRLHQICDDSEIKIIVKEAVSSPVEEVMLLSRFADLLLMNSNTSFAALTDTIPPGFVKEMLAGSQCPVLVLPDKIPPVKEIIFSYNGSYSSMFAIKCFTLMFPDFCKMPVKVVYVTDDEQPADMPFTENLKSYLEAHYPEIDYVILQGDPPESLLNYLSQRNGCIVTYGAFGRSGDSDFFQRSITSNVLSATSIPVFVTHP